MTIKQKHFAEFKRTRAAAFDQCMASNGGSGHRVGSNAWLDCALKAHGLATSAAENAAMRNGWAE